MHGMRLWGAVLALAVAGCTCPGAQCVQGGTATIEVTSTGLPAGVPASIQLTGPVEQALTASGTVSASGGLWEVSTTLVTRADPRIREAFAGEVTNGSFCLAPGATEPVAVSWSPVPTSQQLWVVNRNASRPLAAFSSASLATSTASPVRADKASLVAIGGDLAFDREGNLWGMGPTTADPTLVRVHRQQLASADAAVADTKITLTGGCLPFARGLAFSPQGDLYVSSPCSDAVFRVPAGDLTPLSTKTLSPTSLAVPDPVGLAFDRAGNLWVASLRDEQVWRFDAAALAAGGALTPSLKVGVFARDVMGDTSKFAPSWLAFDANGDLWANDFGANTFYRVPKGELEGAGTKAVQPAVRVVVGVLAVLEGFLFDESGGLWSAGAQGKLIRLAPGQLATSSTSGNPTVPETVIESSDLGSPGNLAIFPAPAALPLFHALP